MFQLAPIPLQLGQLAVEFGEPLLGQSANLGARPASVLGLVHDPGDFVKAEADALRLPDECEAVKNRAVVQAVTRFGAGGRCDQAAALIEPQRLNANARLPGDLADPELRLGSLCHYVLSI